MRIFCTAAQREASETIQALSRTATISSEGRRAQWNLQVTNHNVGLLSLSFAVKQRCYRTLTGRICCFYPRFGRCWWAFPLSSPLLLNVWLSRRQAPLVNGWFFTWWGFGRGHVLFRRGLVYWEVETGLREERSIRLWVHCMSVNDKVFLFVLFYMQYAHLIRYKWTLSLWPSYPLLLFMLSFALVILFSSQLSCLFWKNKSTVITVFTMIRQRLCEN